MKALLLMTFKFLKYKPLALISTYILASSSHTHIHTYKSTYCEKYNQQLLCSLNCAALFRVQYENNFIKINSIIHDYISSHIGSIKLWIKRIYYWIRVWILNVRRAYWCAVQKGYRFCALLCCEWTAVIKNNIYFNLKPKNYGKYVLK